MISHTKKFIFIHIPGTAGTSIEHALSDYQSGRLINTGGGIWVSDENTKKKIKHLFGDIIANNSKHMSAQQWKEVLGEEYDDYYKFTFVRNPYDKAVSLLKFNKKKPLEQPKNVIHQAMYFTNKKDEIIVDDIFKFENLEESWKILCNKLKIKYTPLPHKNNRNPNKIKIDSQLTEEEINLFKKEVVKDFELLGYQ